MKTRIRKIYTSWCVEFPFSVVVYCPDFATALDAFHHFDDYLFECRSSL